MHRPRVEQVALPLRRHQLFEQLPIERRRVAGLGLDAVVLVHEGGGEREQQSGGERRRRLGPARHHLDASRADVGQQLLQARHVEMIVQAFAEGLGDDGEVGMPAGDLQQIAAAQPLQPQRRPLARLAARQQQRPRRVLPEAQGEQGAVGQLVEDQSLDVLRRQAVEQIEDRLVGVGQADQDAVVVVQALRPIAEPLPQPGLQGQAQGQVQPAAEAD